ncbi:MAG: hypothetical protein H0V26_01580 [Solirubrobacterales bacterium]|nr:hypothetical protein [Solirubrobacterales bacterium]
MISRAALQAARVTAAACGNDTGMRRSLTATVLGVLALVGCGGDEDAPATPPENPSAAGASVTDCGMVAVPGHEAVGIRAGGVGCDAAKSVAAAAEGRGRRPYEVEGFGCEPAQAGDGDTNYSCTRGAARISFRYGTA